MSRYRFTIEYDGTPYAGWQRQKDAPSVQGALETALAKLGETALVQGAGRTDAGVHATGQVAHADLVRPWKPFRLMEALNAHLYQSGQPVAIVDCAEADADFHARFSATRRHYVYRIAQRRAALTLQAGRAWQVKVPLDVETMDAAAKDLLGCHDFTTFRSTECQAQSPVKTLDRLDVALRDWHGTKTIEITTNARSYLHNQVRSLAGCLVQVGTGRWSRDDLVRALDARNRSACAPVAPAHGLYLTLVEYGEDG